MTIDHIVNLDI